MARKRFGVRRMVVYLMLSIILLGTIFSLAPISEATGQNNVYSLSSKAEYQSRDINSLITDVYVPQYAYTSRYLEGYVYSHSIDGTPVGDVTVNITTNESNYVVIHTDPYGGARFRIYIGNLGVDTTNLTYVSFIRQSNGTYLYYNGTVPISVRPIRKVVYLRYWAENALLSPGESTKIHVKAEDRFGEPVSGLEVKIETQIIVGTMDNSTNITDNNGFTMFKYHAPPPGNDVDGQIIYDYIRISYVSREDFWLPSMRYGGLVIVVASNRSATWSEVNIVKVSKFGISAGESTQITVKVTDNYDNPIAYKEVHVKALYSTATDPNWYGEKTIVDTTNLTFDAYTKTTNNSGMVKFTLTAIHNVNRPYIIKAYTDDTYTIFSDGAEIYVGDVTPYITQINNHTYTYENGQVQWSNHTSWNNRTVGSDPLIGGWNISYGMIINIAPTISSPGDFINVSLSVFYAMDVTYKEINVTYNATSHQVVNQTVYGPSIIHHANEPAEGVLSYLAVFGTEYGMGANWINGSGTYVWWAAQSFIYGDTDSNGTFGSTLNTKSLSSDEAIYVSGWIYNYNFTANWAPFTGLGFELPYLFGVKSGFYLHKGEAISGNFSLNRMVLTNGENTTNFVAYVFNESGDPVSNATIDVTMSYDNKDLNFNATTNESGIGVVTLEMNGTYPDDTTMEVYSTISASGYAKEPFELYYAHLAWVVDAYKLNNSLGIDEINITSESGMPYIVGNEHAAIILKISSGLKGTPTQGIEVEALPESGTFDNGTKYTNSQGYVYFVYTPPPSNSKYYYNITFVITNGNSTIQQTVMIAVFNGGQIPEFGQMIFIMPIMALIILEAYRRHKN